MNDRTDIIISFIGNDAFRIVVQLVFRFLNQRSDIRNSVHHRRDLIITLKQLDRVEPLHFRRNFCRQLGEDRVEHLFHFRAEAMHRRQGLPLLRPFNGQPRGFLNSCLFQRRNRDDLAAQRLGELLRVDLITVFVDDVDHINGNDDWNAQLQQLRG